MNLRRIIVWALVIGAISYVVGSPHDAGTTAGDAVNTVIGWGKAGISALITFVKTVT